MTQKQQLIAMLDASGTGYGLAEWRDGDACGESVQVEAPQQYEDKWYIAQFEFDTDGKLVAVFGYPGENG